MEYIKEINIIDAVIHVLDNNADEPILNSFALDLNEDTYSFVYKHVKKCLESSALRYALFDEDAEENNIRDMSYSYLKGNTNILEISVKYAEEMFDLMKRKGNIPSCDLLTVSFLTEYGQFIGILKMDYVKNYVHTIDFIDDKVGIDIIEQKSTLPQAGSKIKKAAFIINPSEYGKDYDLLIINKAGKSQDEDYGSDFFVNNFLKCKEIDNERDMTKKFYNTIEKWAVLNLRNNAEDQLRVRLIARDALKNDDVINVDEFADNLYNDEELKKQFKDFLKGMRVPDVIHVDKPEAQKIIRKSKLKLDDDIDISIPAEIMADFNRFEIKRNGDGTINMVIKDIKNYKEK